MKRRIWTITAGLAALAALIAVPAAMAAYTSAKLEVTRTATGVVVKASLDPNDDPTARVAINAPVGTQLTTSQAPGTVLGPVRAIVKALDLAGADLPLEGQLVVAAPGQVPAAAQTACIGSTAPLATWLMVLTAAGTDADGADVPPAAAGRTQLGPAFIAICLPPPDVPVGTPGRATFGAKVYSAELTINGVFSSVAAGAWISSWVPYNPGVGTANVAGAVVAPAAIAPGAVTLSAKTSGKGATLTGRVTQGGQPRAATVTIFGSSKATGLKSVGRARVAANGTFAFKAKIGTFFRARAVAAPGAAPAVCDAAPPADQHGAVRQPDGERLQRAEQGGSQEEVGTALVGGRLGRPPTLSECPPLSASARARSRTRG